MSSKDLWFDNSKRSFSPLYWSMFISSRLVLGLPLAARLEFGKMLLLNPRSRRDYDFGATQPTQSFPVRTEVGEVMVHHFSGKGATLLLSHGWGDTSARFLPMIEQLRAQGYDIYAFDHIGHGKSQGHQSHLFGFINGLQHVIRAVQEKSRLHGIIGHSMGSLAILNLHPAILEKTRMVFIAPPIDFFEDMFVKVRLAGISEKVLLGLLEEFSSVFQKSWKTLSAEKHRDKVHDRTLVIHDRNDRFCRFDLSQQLFSETPALFHPTSDLGHHRILRDPGIIQKLSTHFGMS